jgi:hypothetical protein
MSILALAILNLVLAAALVAVLAAVMTRPFSARRPAQVRALEARERQLRRVA